MRIANEPQLLHSWRELPAAALEVQRVQRKASTAVRTTAGCTVQVGSQP